MHSMHSLTGAYALDALDDTEQAGMLEHLAACADCRFEVESFHQTLATFASLSEQSPPPRLRADVLASIKTVRPLPPLVEVSQPIPGRELSAELSPTPMDVAGARHRNNVVDARHRFRRTIAATAAVAAALIAIAIVVWPTTSSSKPAKVTATEQVRKASDAKSVSLKLNGGASATVVISRSLGKAVLVTDEMPAPPAGEVYQMWFLGANNTYTSAGLMAPSPSQSIALKGDATNSIAVGITLEPSGGSPSPTGSPVATFPLPS